MDITQIAKVLGLIAIGDRRVVDHTSIAAWHDLIGDLNFSDTVTAVREHRRESTEYLVPAHVVAGVRRIRNERLAKHGPVLPDVDPDDVVAYQAERRRLIALIADGHTPERPHLIEPRAPRSTP